MWRGLLSLVGVEGKVSLSSHIHCYLSLSIHLIPFLLCASLYLFGFSSFSRNRNRIGESFRLLFFFCEPRFVRWCVGVRSFHGRTVSNWFARELEIRFYFPWDMRVCICHLFWGLMFLCPKLVTVLWIFRAHAGGGHKGVPECSGPGNSIFFFYPLYLISG